MAYNEMSPADYAAINGNNNSSWGGDWGAWIVLFLIFGMFGFGGFGGFGWGGGFGGMGGANNPGIQGIATRADITEGFALNDIQNGIRGIQQGICDSTYALNNSVTSGFHGVDNAICSLGYNVQQGFNNSNVAMLQGFNAVERGQADIARQVSDCCCQNQRAIDGVNYNLSQTACAITNTLNSNTRDIIDNQNQNSRAILDYLCRDKIETLQQDNQALRLAASQSNQNAVLMAAMDANKAEIIRRTGADYPTASYLVQPPTPINFPTNGCGQVQFGYGCVA